MTTENVLTRVIQSIFGGGQPISITNPLPTTDVLKQGLYYSGTVTAVPGANQFTVPTLAGLGAGKFNGAVNPYRVFVMRDAAGGGIAPQGEIQPVTAYVTASGAFTTTAFTVAVGIGDDVCILHPALADIFTIWAGLAGTGIVTYPAASAPGNGISIAQVIREIYDQIVAMEVLTETGGTILTDTTEQTVYINNAPAGVYRPNCAKVDMTLMGAGNTVIFRVYERLILAGGWVKISNDAANTWAGIQADPAGVVLPLNPNRFGIKVTMQMAGAAISPVWEVIYGA